VGLDGDTINAVAPDLLNPETIFCGVNGGRDGFVCTLTPGGQLYSSTYMGGSCTDQGNAIAIGFTDDYVAGSTASSDFPTTAASVQKPNNVKSNLVSSAGPYFFNQSIIQRAKDLHLCPSNTEQTVFLAIGSKVQRIIGSFRVHTGGVQAHGDALPDGLITETADDGQKSTVLYLTGTPKGPPSTKIVTFIFSDIEYNCEWSKTYTFIVQ
jgi:uncharacterized Zn-binding protein involved in type VI secretion